ncbi:MAG: tetratricopeptide repeat protein [Ignavibacteriaceae bacterium]
MNKMQDLTTNFEKELDQLLKQYFGDEELRRIYYRVDPQKEESNKVSEMINDFYKSQLNIKIDNCNERFKLDRTITFSEKHLIPDKFFEFMLDLGRLCISNSKLNLASQIFKKVYKSSKKLFFKAESMLELGNVFSRRADWIRSLQAISDAAKLYKENYDSSGMAKCYNLMGSIYGERGDMDKAKYYFLESLSLVNTDTETELIANLHTNLGVIDNIQGNVHNGIKKLNKALIIFKKLGHHNRIAEVCHNIGMMYFESGDNESSVKALDEGIEIAKRGHFISALCLLYVAKSEVFISKEDINSAAVFAEKAFEISHDVDDKLAVADIYRVKGIIERYSKNYKLSESYLFDSLRINESLQNRRNIADTSLELAILYKEIENPKNKTFYLGTAQDYYKQIDDSQKLNVIANMLGVEAV